MREREPLYTTQLNARLPSPYPTQLKARRSMTQSFRGDADRDVAAQRGKRASHACKLPNPIKHSLERKERKREQQGERERRERAGREERTRPATAFGFVFGGMAQ